MIFLVCRWIEAMESLPSLLVPGLVHIVNSTDHKGLLAAACLLIRAADIND